MQKRHLALIFLILVSGVVAYQLIDPKLKDQPREVDFSEPPSKLAFDAMKQLEEHDYTYLRTWTFTNRSNLTGEFEITQTRIEHSDDEYRVDVLTDRLSESPDVVYANGFVAWGKFDRGWSWSTQFRPYRDDYSPFERPVYVRNTTVEKVNETSETVVLRVSNSTAAYLIVYGHKPVSEANTQLTLYVDKPSGELSRAVVNGTAPEKEYNKSDEYVFSNYGTTTVTRPAEARYTYKELVWDLMH